MSSTGTTSTDAFDELAAMFMTPDEPAAHSPAPADVAPSNLPRQTFTELLLVGHLPVRGSVWLTPYVDALARDVGPTALIRLGGGDVTLEILRVRESWRSEIAGLPLREVIRRIAREIHAWVIRPNSEDQLPDLLRAGVDRVMLLSSADQAAAVSAYQTIKRLKHAADEENLDLPDLAISMVGCEQSTAAPVAQRMQATAQNQLGVSIELDRVLHRIDSDVRSSVYLRFAGETERNVAELISMIGDAIATSDQVAQVTGGQSPIAAYRAIYEQEWESGSTSAASADSVGTAQPRMRVSQNAANGWDHAEHAEETAQRTADAAAEVAGGSSAASRVKLSPKPAARSGAAAPISEAGADSRGRHGSLAKHVPGLTGLRVRCPFSEHVEIAIDPLGGLHLLAEEAHLRELRVVEAWAKSHRELLAMALAEHGVDSSSEVACHLFTSEPTSVADLHGTGIKLHVLAPVEVDGRTGWYAAALNV